MCLRKGQERLRTGVVRGWVLSGDRATVVKRDSPFVFTGSKVIGQSTAKQFHGQVWPVSSLFRDK